VNSSPSSSPSPSPTPSSPSAASAAAVTNGSLETSLLQQHVSRYLHRRHYVRNGMHGATALKNAAVRHMVAVETSTNDAIQFSSSALDPVAVDQQYSKFKVTLSSTSPVF
jgi:hypothetical protein